jgi:hypothetical protein
VSANTIPSAHRAAFTLWAGFLFAVLPFALILLGPAGKIVERLDPATGRWVDISPPHPMARYAWALVAIGWLLWLYWVYSVQRAVDETTHDASAPSGAKAAGLYLVPLFNLYWVFAWTSGVARSVGQFAHKTVTSGWTAGLFCVGFVLLTLSLIPPGGVLAAALGLAVVLLAAILFSRQLREVI